MTRTPSGTAVGLDRGVRTALVTSGGRHYRAPRISARDAARYLGLQRRMSRQQKGSRRREKTRLAVARITARAADRRRDWAEKISTRLVREHDVIVLEKLTTAGMVRRPAPKPDPERPEAFLPNRARAKAGLNRGILASCWGILGRRLEQKAAASGCRVVYVSPRFTSQQCRACGHIASDSRESLAVFRCVNCGHADHADANAARNILARGLPLADSEPVPARARGQAGARPRKTPARPARREPPGARHEPPTGNPRPSGQGGSQVGTQRSPASQMLRPGTSSTR